jgi:hypothetical protein
MDQHRLTVVKRTLTKAPSRRDVLRGLAAIGIALGTARLPVPVVAENPYGCQKVGERCKRADQCCSGICTGKRRKKKCQAHGTGTCDQQAGGMCDGVDPNLVHCSNSTTCLCVRTTAGSSFCGDISIEVSGCADCQSDADCERQGFPPGSACAPFVNGACAGTCPSGMVCMGPCGYEPTEPAARGARPGAVARDAAAGPLRRLATAGDE